jgi:argininosuccinate lyase
MNSSGENTGRIRAGLVPSARAILFERDLWGHIQNELADICRIDFAHIVMLMECGVIQAAAGKRLLSAIMDLVQAKFSPLEGRSAPRGMFLLYESYLIEKEGSEVGGVLQSGRSRNDLNATLLKLRLRKPYSLLLRSMLRLQAVLIGRARRYSELCMPAYTHGQPAEPITYGHYLNGVAQALNRDLEALEHVGQDMDVCPLGSGAVAGSSLPIQPSRTAELLGFGGVTLNSVDAVASRDVALRLLSALAICGCTLSRIATDLLQWSTSEFGFLSFPDELVGSSSAMPQKRNPFILEHVQGRSASPLGFFVSSVGATRNVPFTNSISVGTESIRYLWSAIGDVIDSADLLRLVIGGARPNGERMIERAEAGLTAATAVANILVSTRGRDFRSAHRLVGEMITEGLAKGRRTMREILADHGDTSGLDVSATYPPAIARRTESGGGPGPASFARCLAGLQSSWKAHAENRKASGQKWAAAEAKLLQTVTGYCNA